MAKSRTILNLLAAMAIAAAGVPLVAGTAQAYACKGYPTQSTATRHLKNAARGAARKNWSASVKGQFGLPWSVWSIAQVKSVSCYKSGSKHTCLASAKPCKYVVQ